jgi:hypothetical protein
MHLQGDRMYTIQFHITNKAFIPLADDTVSKDVVCAGFQ